MCELNIRSERKNQFMYGYSDTHKTVEKEDDT